MAIPGPGAPPPPEPGILKRLLSPPDPLQVDAGAQGELLVARVRLLLILLLLPIPLSSILFGNNVAESAVGISDQSFGSPLRGNPVLRPGARLLPALAGLCQQPDGRNLRQLRAGGLSPAGRAAHHRQQPPHLRGVFPRHRGNQSPLRLASLARRGPPGDRRVHGYWSLVATSLWDLNDPRYAPFPYGLFDWSTQISRLILLGVASILAAAIVLRSQSLRRLSRSDRLTGLPNRSYFDERVIIELSRARRYGQPLTMAMIDVDFFKRFNDTYGHAAGDVALRMVARSILESIRQSDLIVRYGGEEFVAVFPGMDPAAAFERVEAIRNRIAAVPILLPRRLEALHLTISAGIAVYGADGTSAEDLLDTADNRLFAAKEAGRNRVVGPPPGLVASA